MNPWMILLGKEDTGIRKMQKHQNHLEYHREIEDGILKDKTFGDKAAKVLHYYGQKQSKEGLCRSKPQGKFPCSLGLMTHRPNKF
jgi:hypothetical protein